MADTTTDTSAIQLLPFTRDSDVDGLYDDPLLPFDGDSVVGGLYEDDAYMYGHDGDSGEIPKHEVKWNFRPVAISLLFGFTLLLAMFIPPGGPCAKSHAVPLILSCLPLLLSVVLLIGARVLIKNGKLHKFLYCGNVKAEVLPDSNATIWLMVDGQPAVLQPYLIYWLLISWLLTSVCVIGTSLGQAYSRPYLGNPSTQYEVSLDGYPGIDGTPIPNVTWPTSMSHEEVQQICSSITFDFADKATSDCAYGHKLYPFCTADTVATCSWKPTAEIYPERVEWLTTTYKTPWCLATHNSTMRWMLTPPLLSAFILALLVAVRSVITVSSAGLKRMVLWRRKALVQTQFDSVEKILAPPVGNHTYGTSRLKTIIVNTLLFTVSLVATYAYMPRILTMLDPPQIIHDLDYSEDALQNKLGTQFGMTLCFFSSFVTMMCAMYVWLSSLPSDITNDRLKKLTKELKKICAVKFNGDSEYKILVSKLENWFQLRRQVFIGSRYEYRSLESLLFGDILLFLAMIIGALAITLPPVIRTGDLGGENGTIALSLPVVLLSLLWVALSSLYVHSWGLIYTAGSEVEVQKRVLGELSTAIQAAIIPNFKINDMEIIQSYEHFKKLELRISVTDNDQPTIFGIKIQPTFRNVILSTGGTVIVSMVLAITHQFF